MTNIIREGLARDASVVAEMVGELLREIMQAIAQPAFTFDQVETTATLAELLHAGKYRVFIAQQDNGPVGFLTLYESYALYAQGAFGTIAELYVRPAHRSAGVGAALLKEARAFARRQGWKRLEVTTPPIPPFEKTLSFYEREGFAVSGGRKLRALIAGG